jgi:hypothetical protein
VLMRIYYRRRRLPPSRVFFPREGKKRAGMLEGRRRVPSTGARPCRRQGPPHKAAELERPSSAAISLSPTGAFAGTPATAKGGILARRCTATRAIRLARGEARLIEAGCDRQNPKPAYSLVLGFAGGTLPLEAGLSCDAGQTAGTKDRGQ